MRRRDQPKSSISLLVEHAFKNVAYPGDEHLWDSRVFETDVWENVVLGKTWQQSIELFRAMDEVSANYYESMFTWLTVESFIYFAPVGLILGLDEKYIQFTEGFFYHLYIRNGTPSAEYLSILGKLTPSQCSSIAAVLRYTDRLEEEGYSQWRQWVRKLKQ